MKTTRVLLLAVIASGMLALSGCSGSDMNEIKQPYTDLYWLRCPLGQTWNGSACTGKTNQMDWTTAQSACPEGFRVPTRQEFMSLLGGCDGRIATGIGWKRSSKSAGCRS